MSIRKSKHSQAFIQRMAIAASALVAALALTAAPALAQSKPQSAPPAAPSAPPQSLGALPSAQDMIDRWLPICVDNAGDPAAQRRAGQAANLVQPYMLRVEEGSTIGDACTLVAIAGPQSTAEGTAALLQTQLSARGTINIAASGQYFGGDFVYRGYSYRVIGLVQPQNSGPTPTFIIVLSTGEGRTPPRPR